MRITLVVSSLSSGGAERVMSIIAKYRAEHGEDVTLITIDSRDSDFYMLSPLVKRIALGVMCDSPTIWAAIKNNTLRIRRLRAAIRATRPEVVISFGDQMNVLTLVATRGLSVPVVVSERIDPRYHRIGRIWDQLRRWSYSLAPAIVVQSAAIRDWMSRIVPGNRVHIIPNPIRTVGEVKDDSSWPQFPSPFIVSMGRLERQKGFDLLLHAFAHCKQQNWHLVILGEGSQRNNLESLVSRLGLELRVHLPGRVIEPTVVLRRASLFVLSSRYEGFPNALLEAMSCGLAVVSFDCPTGPGDIVSDRNDGVLVPPEDVDALAAAMDRLMHDEAERKSMGNQALNVRERFSIEIIMGQWDKLLGEVIDED